MKHLRTLTIITATLVLIPFFTNVFGWNILVHSFIGTSSAVIAVEDGHCHISCHGGHEYIEGSEDTVESDVLIIDFDYQLLELGDLGIFLSRRSEALSPIKFRIFTEDGRSGFEFPWLLLLLVPLTLKLTSSKLPLQNKIE